MNAASADAQPALDAAMLQNGTQKPSKVYTRTVLERDLALQNVEILYDSNRLLKSQRNTARCERDMNAGILANARSQIDLLTTNNINLSNQLAQLTLSNGQLSLQVTNLNTQLSGKTTEVVTLNEQVQDLKVDIKDLELRLSQALERANILTENEFMKILDGKNILSTAPNSDKFVFKFTDPQSAK